jgi:hypothetical protein
VKLSCILVLCRAAESINENNRGSAVDDVMLAGTSANQVQGHRVVKICLNVLCDKRDRWMLEWTNN